MKKLILCKRKEIFTHLQIALFKYNLYFGVLLPNAHGALGQVTYGIIFSGSILFKREEMHFPKGTFINMFSKPGK